jgi:uncharacterized protein YndB with AHSA1/START domain
MKNIKKSYLIKTSREDVYTALTNPLTIELWTGSPAIMVPEAGTDFSLWDGEITGTNLEIIENQFIKQEWDFEGEGTISVVTLTLMDEGKFTRVELLHTGIPDEAFENILEGWNVYYFRPLRELLED